MSLAITTNKIVCGSVTDTANLTSSGGNKDSEYLPNQTL